MSSLTIFKGTPSERTVTPEEVENLYNHALDAFDELNVYKEVCFDSFEELLLSEDYESQEELNHRLNEEYFQVYELTNEQMLEFARAGDEYYGD